LCKPYCEKHHMEDRDHDGIVRVNTWRPAWWWRSISIIMYFNV
jgi:hypothetical protein